MKNNLSYNEKTVGSLPELILLKKKIAARLSGYNRDLKRINKEINSLKQQNKFLKKDLYQKMLLIEQLNSY